MITRTVTGNRIDSRLALGIARGMIRDIDADQRNAGAARSGPTKSRADRVSAIKGMVSYLGIRCAGAVARKHFMEAQLGRISVLPREDGGSPNLLVLEILEVALSRNKQPQGFGGDPVSGRYMMASIGEHVIARMVQRGGIQNLKEVNSVLRLGAGWAVAANLLRDPSPFYIPVPEGLFCMRMKRVDVDVDFYDDTKETKRHSFHMADFSTFIDKESLSARNNAIWNDLVDQGALDTPFPFPSYERISDESVELLKASQAYGRMWLERKGMELDDPFDQDLIPSSDSPEP